MARIQPISLTEISPAVKVAFERHINEYKERITNTKATLAHSLVAFDAYMQWYPLYEAVEQITGNRLAYLFGYSISKESSCTLCSTFFRKQIIDNGEDPDNLLLTQAEKNLVDFGEAISRCSGNIANHLYNTVAKQYSQKDLVTLIAFAGQMVALNIFNNVAETETDDFLHSYLPVTKSIWQ